MITLDETPQRFVAWLAKQPATRTYNVYEGRVHSFINTYRERETVRCPLASWLHSLRYKGWITSELYCLVKGVDARPESVRMVPSPQWVAEAHECFYRCNHRKEGLVNTVDIWHDLPPQWTEGIVPNWEIHP